MLSLLGIPTDITYRGLYIRFSMQVFQTYDKSIVTDSSMKAVSLFQKIILRQVPEGIFSNKYFLAKHRCMQINGNRRCTSCQALICTIFKISIILEEHVTYRI